MSKLTSLLFVEPNFGDFPVHFTCAWMCVEVRVHMQELGFPHCYVRPCPNEEFSDRLSEYMMFLREDRHQTDLPVDSRSHLFSRGQTLILFSLKLIIMSTGCIVYHFDYLLKSIIMYSLRMLLCILHFLFKGPFYTETFFLIVISPVQSIYSCTPHSRRL